MSAPGLFSFGLLVGEGGGRGRLDDDTAGHVLWWRDLFCCRRASLKNSTATVVFVVSVGGAVCCARGIFRASRCFVGDALPPYVPRPCVRPYDKATTGRGKGVEWWRSNFVHLFSHVGQIDHRSRLDYLDISGKICIICMV